MSFIRLGFVSYNCDNYIRCLVIKCISSLIYVVSIYVFAFVGLWGPQDMCVMLRF